jgi:hypothetical protein
VVNDITVGILPGGTTVTRYIARTTHFIGSLPIASSEVGNRRSRMVNPVIVGSTGWPFVSLGRRRDISEAVVRPGSTTHHDGYDVNASRSDWEEI